MTSIFHLGMSPLELSLKMSADSTRVITGETPRNTSITPDKVWKEEPPKLLISPVPQSDKYANLRKENQTPPKTYTPNGTPKQDYKGNNLNTTA